MQLKQVTILALALFVLTACQHGSTPSVTTEPGGGPAHAQATSAQSSPVIWVDPTAMKSCKNVVADVHLDTGRIKINTSNTEIWTGADAKSMKLFSAGGESGEIKTGRWAHPGMHFLLKDKQDGKVLGEAVIGGPSCH